MKKICTFILSLIFITCLISCNTSYDIKEGRYNFIFADEQQIKLEFSKDSYFEMKIINKQQKIDF